jgi:hypothetical protein
MCSRLAAAVITSLTSLQHRPLSRPAMRVASSRASADRGAAVTEHSRRMSILRPMCACRRGGEACSLVFARETDASDDPESSPPSLVTNASRRHTARHVEVRGWTDEGGMCAWAVVVRGDDDETTRIINDRTDGWCVRSVVLCDPPLVTVRACWWTIVRMSSAMMLTRRVHATYHCELAPFDSRRCPTSITCRAVQSHVATRITPLTHSFVHSAPREPIEFLHAHTHATIDHTPRAHPPCSSRDHPQ